MTDTVADMITRIRNAARVRHESVTMPYSAYRETIANTLVRGGYLSNVQKTGKRVGRVLECSISYFLNADGEKTAKIIDMQRVSKSSRRVYQGSKDIRVARGKYESYVLSTPKGILFDREAKKEGVGGEVLFKVQG